jgi:SAM-dependent methyltransferase
LNLRSIALKVLDNPFWFDSYQWVVGAPNCQRMFMHSCVMARAKQRILDIGCGVGAGLRYLPVEIDYLGVDISASYIAKAQTDFGNRGRFMTADITTADPAGFGQFDLAYAFGVLHHLSDAQVQAVGAFLQATLRPGQRFVTIDPCYREGQNRVARYIISQDRGEYVRTAEGYTALLAPFGRVNSRYEEDVLRIPYTQLIMTMTV